VSNEHVIGIRLTADGKALIGEAKAATKAIDDLGAGTKRAESQAIQLNSAVKVLAAGLATLGVGRLIQESTMLAARHETMGIVMEVAGKNAGYTREQMDRYSVSLQKSGISMLQSRDALVQLATANIDLSKAQALGRAAQDLAVVGNTNSSAAMARMIHGIKSGQIEVLRTLGLNVTFENGYKSLAAQLGKNVDALTEQERVLSRTNTVLEGSARFTGIYEASMSTAGKAMGSLVRITEDLMIKLGQPALPAFTALIFGVTDALKILDRNATTVITALTGISTAIGVFVAGKAVIFIYGHVTALIAFRVAALAAAQAEAARLVGNVAGAQAALINANATLAQSTAAYKAAVANGTSAAATTAQARAATAAAVANLTKARGDAVAAGAAVAHATANMTLVGSLTAATTAMRVFLLTNPVGWTILAASAAGTGAMAWYAWGDAAKTATKTAQEGLIDTAAEFNSLENTMERMRAMLDENDKKATEESKKINAATNEYLEGSKKKREEMGLEQRQLILLQATREAKKQPARAEEIMLDAGMTLNKMATAAANKALVDLDKTSVDFLKTLERQRVEIGLTSDEVFMLAASYQAAANPAMADEIMARAIAFIREKNAAADAAKATEDLAKSHEKAAADSAAAWDRFDASVQRSLGDSLMMAMQGNFKGIADMFKQMLMRMAADAAAARITVAILGSVGTAGVANASGQMVGATAGSGLAGLIGTPAIAATGTAAAMGPTIGTAATGMGGMGAAMTAAAPYVAAIAGAYVIAKYGFGIGNERENVGGNRLVGQFNRSGFSGNRQQSWTQDGGWFGSDSSGTVNTAVGRAELKAFQGVVNDLQGTFNALGSAIGYSAVETKEWNVNINAAGDVTGLLADGIGLQLVPSLELFREAGENLAQVAVRLTTIFQSTSYFISALGISADVAFGKLGIGGTVSRDALIKAAGGLDKFNAIATSFIANFLTDAQKLAPALDAVGRTFYDLGIAGVSTNEQFTALVAAATEAGDTDRVAALLNVSEAFNAITVEAKKTTDALTALIDIDSFSSLVDYQRAVGLAAASAGGGAGAQIAGATSEAGRTGALEANSNAISSARSQAYLNARSQYDNEYSAYVVHIAKGINSQTGHYSESEAAAFINRNFPEWATRLAAIEAMPKFASGGSHAGGLRIVGENGPELEATGPSRIISNSDLMNKFGAGSGNNALVAEIRALRAEVSQLRGENRAGQIAIAGNTGRTAKLIERFDGDGMPPVRV